jgi:hypothetical protein
MERPAAERLPSTVRYVKNGPGGRWWKAAKASAELHAGWKEVPADLLEAADLVAIEPLARDWWKGRRGATQDFNALRTLVERPSQHIWITFEEGCLWWCTVFDTIEANPAGDTVDRGHFWLKCDLPWSDRPVDGGRRLVMTELPGSVTAVAGFRATVCAPAASDQILRIIQNQENPLARAAGLARRAYQDAIAKLVTELGPRDFEVLVDLILSRAGWVRLAVVGGTRADIDIEVENLALDEIAFVQVKSSAGQGTFNQYVQKFKDQKARYRRMIFAVHTPAGTLTPPEDRDIQIWTGDRIAELVVKHGLGDWVASRL